MSMFTKRPALVLISFILGVFLFRYSLFISLAFFILSLISLLFLGKRGLVLLLCATLFASGGFYTTFVNETNTRKAKKLLSSEDFIKGTVISLPEEESYGKSFVVLVNGVKVLLMSRGETVNYKDRISFKGSFSLPDGRSRSFDFDYPSYLKSKGIYITCFAEEINVSGSEKSSFNIKDTAVSLKEKLIKKADLLWEGEKLMFARAILLGDSSLSSEEFRTKVGDGSISHVISVSGTHVSLVAAAVMFLLKGISVKRRYLKFLSLPFVIFFVTMVTPVPSAMRSAIMFIFYVFAWVLFFHNDSITSLIVSAFLILVYNPFSLFSLNFLLSFGAILGIIIFTKPIISYLKVIPIPYITDCLSVTIAAQILIMPIIAFTFGKIPLFSLFANLLVVPLVPFIMGFGYLALALPQALPFDELTDLLMTSSLKIAEFFGKIPFANINLVFASVPLLLLTFVFFIIFLYTFLVKKNKILTFILVNIFLASLLLSFTSPLLFPDKSTYFLDSGQGSVTVALNKSSSIVIDLDSSNEDFFKDTLIPFLKRKGYSSLDVLVLTEYNEDKDSLLYFIESFPVKNLILPEGAGSDLLSDTLKSRRTSLFYASEKDSFTLGNLSLFVPYEALGKATYILRNEESEILITGNIATYEEEALAESLDKNSRFDVLIAPRHGNKGSCTEKLLNAAKAENIIVSTNRSLSSDFSTRLNAFNVISTRDAGDITLSHNQEIKTYKRGD